MPRHIEDRDARRRFLTAWTILWGNSGFAAQRAATPSADGEIYTVKNLQYATALMDAVAQGLDVGMDGKIAVKRATGALDACLSKTANSDQEAGIRLHSGKRAPLVTPANGGGELLGALAFLASHAQRLKVPGPLHARVTAVGDALVRAHVARSDRVVAYAGRSELNKQIPRLGTLVDWVGAADAALGTDFHWSDLIVGDFAEFYSQSLPGGFPWPYPQLMCDALPECETTMCWVGHIPVKFFKGKRRTPDTILPVVLVAGWQVQFSVHTGGGTFGDESSYSILPPPHSPPGNNANHIVPPPVLDVELGIPPYRDFPGLGTMLRCAAGYDHVSFGQSHPGGPIQDSVEELKAVVDRTKTLYGVEKVILACHSRGGLIARKCILDRWQQDQAIDVDELITYSSPHKGAALATVGEDILAEVIPGMLLAAALFSPSAISLPAEALDTVGLLLGPHIEQQIQDQILQLVVPLVTPIWPNFAGFVASGEEFRPDSSFITNLNEGYANAAVPVKGQSLSLWEAINTVLVAGTSPDFLTVYLGTWLAGLSALDLIEAQTPRLGTRVVKILGAEFTIPYWYYRWKWHWLPIVRFVSDVMGLIPELGAIDTFKEGLGDAVVERTSALAEGVVGVRRAEYPLNHFNLKANNERQTIYESPVGVRPAYPWQLLFLELGIDPTLMTSACSPDTSACTNFVFADAFS